jgi:hypothetical protein
MPVAAPARATDDGISWGVIATVVDPGTPKGGCSRTGMTYRLERFDWGLIESGIYPAIMNGPVTVDLECEPGYEHIYHPADGQIRAGDRHAFNLHFQTEGNHVVRLTTDMVVEVPVAPSPCVD